MTATVNGREYSRASLAEIYWSFGEMISYASRGTRVEPGDVIGSGTCGTGCILELALVHGADAYPWLQPGDEVVLERRPARLPAQPRRRRRPAASRCDERDRAGLRRAPRRASRSGCASTRPRDFPRTRSPRPTRPPASAGRRGRCGPTSPSSSPTGSARPHLVVERAAIEPGAVRTHQERPGAASPPSSATGAPTRARLWDRAAGDIATPARLPRPALDDSAWAARGLHPTLGEMDLAKIVDEFLVGHLEQHAAQLDQLAASGR